MEKRCMQVKILDVEASNSAPKRISTYHRRQKQHLPDIPRDIIIKILVRLPVRSLLRFRSVCKYWLSLISSPRFIKLHLEFAKNPTSLDHKSQLIFQKYPSLHVTSVNYRTLDLVHHICPILGYHPNAEVLASCDGLLLVCVAYSYYFLWNPTTRRDKIIASLHDDNRYPLFRKELKSDVRLYGLGYDSSADAYKVISIIRVTTSLCHLIQYDVTYISIYDCNTCIWKHSSNFPYQIFANGQGVVVNRAPHWIVCRTPPQYEGRTSYLGPRIVESDGTMVREHVLIYYDWVEERFQELPNPNWLNHDSLFDLGKFQGLLCLARHEVSATEVWVMKEYNVQESWTRLFAIPKTHVDNFVPLGMDNDEVLVEDRRHKLTTYNLSSGNAQEILRFRNACYKVKFKSISYEETLVSPGED